MKSDSRSKTVEKEQKKTKEVEELANELLDPNRDLEEIFPNLAQEIHFSEMKLPMKGIRWSSKEFHNLEELRSPDVIAFIRRCSYIKEASEIINFLLSREEITREYAEKLKYQLENQGLRSFGPKKGPNYYEKKYRILEE